MLFRQKVRKGFTVEWITLTTPLDAIKRFCDNCQGYNTETPIECTNFKCQLYGYRNGRTIEDIAFKTPLEAIEYTCNKCKKCEQNYKIATLNTDCPFFHYQYGTDPMNKKPVVFHDKCLSDPHGEYLAGMHRR